MEYNLRYRDFIEFFHLHTLSAAYTLDILVKQGSLEEEKANRAATLAVENYGGIAARSLKDYELTTDLAEHLIHLGFVTPQHILDYNTALNTPTVRPQDIPKPNDTPDCFARVFPLWTHEWHKSFMRPELKAISDHLEDSAKYLTSEEATPIDEEKSLNKLTSLIKSAVNLRDSRDKVQLELIGKHPSIVLETYKSLQHFLEDYQEDLQAVYKVHTEEAVEIPSIGWLVTNWPKKEGVLF